MKGEGKDKGSKIEIGSIGRKKSQKKFKPSHIILGNINCGRPKYIY